MNVRRVRGSAALALSALVGAGAGVGAYAAAGVERGAAAARPAATATPAAATATTVTALYKQAAASVVEISTTSSEGFGPYGGGAREGVGSGFVYDTAGHVVTNAHVVDGADTVTVAFADGTQRHAEVIGTDESTDIAVLEVDAPADELKPLRLGGSGSVDVGEPVVAIGSPFGLEGTITAGIVSAVGRRITSPNGYAIAGAIQTDAAINHGNSGGPLLDADGRVIGVNAQIESDGGGSDGVGFAIPSDTVRSVVRQLLIDGRADHAYLGVQIADASPSRARQAGAPARPAVQLTAVVGGGPAARAGLQTGDVVTAVGGGSVTSSSSLQAAIAARRPGERVAVTLYRDGRRRTITVALGARPS